MEAEVIVIGAGAAGLAAARRLARRAFRVVVVESRDRIGGRVLTRAGPTPLTPVELGAEFVHGPAEETRTLLREAGSTAVDIGGESWVYDDGAVRRDEDDFIASAGIFEQTQGLTEDESVDRFLQRFERDDATRAAAKAARAFVEGFEAADPAIASVRAIGDEWRSGVDTRSARPLGGYAPLFERLRGDCAAAGVALRLSTTARRIAWQAGAVTVSVGPTDPHMATETLRARAAILTLPAGVLRDPNGAVAFEPGLPAAKREALARIEMGHAVKIVLTFRTPFWERARGGRYRDAAFFRCETGPFAVYWTQVPVRGESVVAWAGGPKAIALQGMPESKLIELALTSFATALGEPERAQAELAGGAMHDWTADAFARGAYSYVAVGGEGARAALAAPLDGSLFFAGEATSTDGQGGTVNGALQTGERAANEVVTALG